MLQAKEVLFFVAVLLHTVYQGQCHGGGTLDSEGFVILEAVGNNFKVSVNGRVAQTRNGKWQLIIQAEQFTSREVAQQLSGIINEKIKVRNGNVEGLEESFITIIPTQGEGWDKPKKINDTPIRRAIYGVSYAEVQSEEVKGEDGVAGIQVGAYIIGFSYIRNLTEDKVCEQYWFKDFENPNLIPGTVDYENGRLYILKEDFFGLSKEFAINHLFATGPTKQEVQPKSPADAPCLQVIGLEFVGDDSNFQEHIAFKFKTMNINAHIMPETSMFTPEGCQVSTWHFSKVSYYVVQTHIGMDVIKGRVALGCLVDDPADSDLFRREIIFHGYKEDIQNLRQYAKIHSYLEYLPLYRLISPFVYNRSDPYFLGQNTFGCKLQNDGKNSKQCRVTVAWVEPVGPRRHTHILKFEGFAGIITGFLKLAPGTNEALIRHSFLIPGISAEDRKSIQQGLNCTKSPRNISGPIPLNQSHNANLDEPMKLSLGNILNVEVNDTGIEIFFQTLEDAVAPKAKGLATNSTSAEGTRSTSARTATASNSQAHHRKMRSTSSTDSRKKETER